MATLYTQKDSNVRKTYLLFTAFFVVIIGLGWGFSYIYKSPGILFFAVIFSSVMSYVSYWYSDQIVLRMSNAAPVTKAQEPQLWNMVENLSITAGLPMPKLYVIYEDAPNAFATGRDPEHGVIAVTRGLLERLNKNEIEGVLAHELSHIGNRDTLISTIVVILVGFISLISDFFLRTSLFSRGRDRDEGGGQGGNILVLVGIALAIISPIVAMLMQLAISRKREFLADASGALLTRYPEGLASALVKISRDSTPLHVANNTTSHLWIDDPFHVENEEKKISLIHKLFMTHPPVHERVAALRNLPQ
jgi:heat shock protein HtpX